jgi:TRAP-type uncharacterized transport system substrate-binding protein
MKQLMTFTIALLLSAFVAAGDVTMCTGGKSGKYFEIGSKMATLSRSFDDISITPLITNGSWENIKAVADGEKCQVAVVQADAYALFAKKEKTKAANLDRLGVLHKEFAHMVCNRDADVDTGKLESGKITVAVGKVGSGAAVTWENWVSEDDDYGNAPLLNEGGMRVWGKVADGVDAQCVLMMTAVGSSSMHKLDDRFGDRLELIDMDDGDFNDPKDPKGNRLYFFAEIAGNAYPANMKTFGDRDTIYQNAIILVNADIFYEDEDMYDAMAEIYSMVRKQYK